MMKRVFCYYRKSIHPDNPLSPSQSISHQDRMLSNYCSSKNLQIIKRFSDLGYRGSPLTRPELVQMRRTMEKPKNKVDLLVLYSIKAIEKETKYNEMLLLQIIKQIGDVHFFKENLTLNYEWFRLYLEALENKKLTAFKQTLTENHRLETN